jgi:hypothetical protein
MKASSAQINASFRRLQRYLRKKPLPPHYGQSDGLEEIRKVEAEFNMSIYDAAPKRVRLAEHEDGVSLAKWWDPLEYDSRPMNNRPKSLDELYYTDRDGNYHRRPSATPMSLSSELTPLAHASISLADIFG